MGIAKDHEKEVKALHKAKGKVVDKESLPEKPRKKPRRK